MDLYLTWTPLWRFMYVIVDVGQKAETIRFRGSVSDLGGDWVTWDEDLCSFQLGKKMRGVLADSGNANMVRD